MENTEVIVAITGILGALVGALIGGVAVFTAMNSAVKSVLASPLLIAQSEALASSWPAGAREFLNNVAKVVGEATDGVPYSSKPTANG